MRKPLEAKAGLGRAWAGLATVRGGLRGGASPACGVLGARAAYRPRYLAQKAEDNGVVLTEAQIGPEL